MPSMIGVRHRIAIQAGKTILRQQRTIVSLEQTVIATELAYMHIGRDLIEQFIFTLDHPEIHDEIRERLWTSLGFYRDEIAVREEHV